MIALREMADPHPATDTAHPGDQPPVRDPAAMTHQVRALQTNGMLGTGDWIPSFNKN